jgi:hypothetical protein
MAIFAFSAATQTTSVTNSATQIFNTSASGIPTGVTLKDLIIENQGSQTVFVGGSTVTAATGLPVPAGAQVTFNGWAFAQGAAGGNVYAIVSSGTAQVTCGLATVNANA